MSRRKAVSAIALALAVPTLAVADTIVLGNAGNFTSATMHVANYLDGQPIDVSIQGMFAMLGQAGGWNIIGGQSPTATGATVQHVFVQYTDQASGCVSGNFALFRYHLINVDVDHAASWLKIGPTYTRAILSKH